MAAPSRLQAARWIGLALALGVAASAAPARAAGPAPSRAERAAELWREGMDLLKRRQIAAALERFTQSREQQVDGSNTWQAALCLDALGRYDEALDLFDLTLARFAKDLTPANQANIGKELQRLALLVGMLEIEADVDGFEVSIDGHARRDLPEPRHVRVIGGTHTLRLTRNGFEPFERQVTVGVGATEKVTAALRPLGSWIRVQAEGDRAAPELTVFVDGEPTGTTPWAGPVAPGTHVVWGRRPDAGSVPVQVQARAGAVTHVRLAPRPLGPPLRLYVEPDTAALSVDGVEIAHGTWEGRLPLGRYAFEARGKGYHPVRRPLEVTATSAPSLRVALEQNLDDPSWGPRRIRLWAGPFGGPALGRSLGSDPEGFCPQRCAAHQGPIGVLAGLRGGLRLATDTSVEVSAGYAWVHATVSRKIQTTFTNGQVYPITYAFADDILLRGPLVAVGVSQRMALGSRFELTGRITGGFVVASSYDYIQGQAYAGRETIPLAIETPTSLISSIAPFVMPELGAGARFGAFTIGVSVGAGFFPGEGPNLGITSVGKSSDFQGQCSSLRPGVASCAPTVPLLAQERAYGPFVLFTPQIFAEYVFR